MFHDVRHMLVIGPVDHGKSTLINSIASSAKSVVGTPTSITKVTFDTTFISLTNHIADPCLYPSNPDSFRTMDGVCVVVDCIESLHSPQYLPMLLSSNQWQPILFINKMDRFIFHLDIRLEQCYQTLRRVIDPINEQNVHKFDPLVGNVIFGSALYGFSFTLLDWAEIYQKKFGVSKEKIVQRLWGDWYFDRETVKWTRSSVSKSGKIMKRSFCEFILQPLFATHRVVINRHEKPQDLVNIVKTLNIILENDYDSLSDRDLTVLIWKKFLPLGKCFSETVIKIVPSKGRSCHTRLLQQLILFQKERHFCDLQLLLPDDGKSSE